MLRGEWLLRLRKLIWHKRTYAKRQHRCPQNWLRRPTRRRRLHARELETLETRTLLSGVQIVKDVNPATDSADPREFAQLGGMTYFTANDGTHGYELWKTDGTAEGTVLVEDINPGGNGSSPFNLTVLGDEIYFGANDGTNGVELWKTDGTEDGTTLVSDIAPGVASSNVAHLTVLGDEIYFRANDGANGTELWKTDGTTTELVADIYAGSGYSNPTYLTAFEDHIYFRADDNAHGSELWRTDGTTTELVKDIRIGSGDGNPGSLAVFNGSLYFQAIDATSGYELWKTDGTESGTELVKDINPGSEYSAPSQMTVLGNELYFQANDGTHGYELWRTDGTEQGTQLVKDINPGSENASLSGLIVFKNELYFRASDTTHGYEFWKSNGTEEGTVLVKDINPGSENSSPGLLTVIGDTLYFNAIDATYGAELWKSDGTEQGTVLVKDVLPGSASSNPLYSFVANDTLFFQANDGSHGIELWTSDGTEEGTTLFKDINAIKSDSTPTQFIQLGSDLFFTANDPTHGIELWKTDGTKAGTVLVKDIRPGIYGSNPTHLTVFNGKLYFTANSDRELWTSDGTESGTVLVKDVNSTGIISSDAQGFAVLNGALYFGVQSWSDGAELWKTDGTFGGTTRVKALYSDDPYNATAPGSLTVVGNDIYFLATNNSYQGNDLWKSDGTSGGTIKLVDDYTSPLSGINNLTALNNKLYFSAYYSYFNGIIYQFYGRELWTITGSTPQIVKDIYSGSSSASPQNLTLFNSQLYFTANDGTHGNELWRTNGTGSGTVRVTDINAGGANANPSGLTAIGSKLYFYADDGTNGHELWSTDGSTVAFMKDINPGSGSSSPSGFTGFDGEVFFLANDGSNGAELWKTDGTPSGTQLVADIEPGAGSSNPQELTPLGQQLSFSAETAESGGELWSYYINAPAVLASNESEVVINEGETATNSGTYSDEAPGSVTLDASLGTIINNGDGTWSWSLATDDNLPGPVTVTITATDDIGNESDTTFTLTVNNIAPALTIAGASSINEAATYTLDLTSSDIPNDTITSWFINWGDGSDPDNDNTPGEIIVGNPSHVTHAYADGSRSFTINATATDEDGTYRAESTGMNAIASPDSSFGDGGEVIQGFSSPLDDRPIQVIEQSDGKLIEIGYSSTSGLRHSLMARWNTDGTLDTTFGDDGRVFFEFSGGFQSALVLDDGKILVGSYQALWRFNADGSLDDSFGIDGKLAMPSSVNQLFLDSTGRILAGNTSQIYRLLADGTLDLTFGNAAALDLTDQTNDGINDNVNRIKLDDTDRLVVTGGRQTGNWPATTYDIFARRYDINGHLDTSFGTDGLFLFNYSSVDNPNFQESITQLVLEGETIHIGGTVTDYRNDTSHSQSILFLRLTGSGALDSGFGDDGVILFNRPNSTHDYLSAFELDSAGRILGFQGSQLMRFSSSGVWDETYGLVNVGYGVNQFIVTEADTIYFRVTESVANESYNLGILRLNADGSRDTDYGNNGLALANFNGPVSGYNNFAFRLDDGKLLTFGQIGGGNSGTILQRYLFDGTLDTAFGTDGQIFIADIYPNQVIEDGNEQFYVQTGNQIRRYTADGTLDTTFGSNGILTPNVGNISKFTMDESGRLIVSGVRVQSAGPGLMSSSDIEIRAFSSAGVLDTNFGTNGVFQFDNGTTDSVRIDDFVRGLAIDAQGRIVIAGYSQQEIDFFSYVITGLLMRLNPDGTFDTTFSAGGSGIVENDGSIYSGVIIDSQQRIVGLLNTSTIERRLADGTLDTSFGDAGSVDTIYAQWFTLDDTGRIVLFTYDQVQRLLPDGEFDESFGSEGTLELANELRIMSLIAESEHVLLVGYQTYTQTSENMMWLGQYITGGLSVQVNNVNPSTPVVTGPSTANEGDTIALSVSSSDVAGENDPLTYSWTIYFNGTQVKQKSGTDISFVAADSGTYRAYILVQDGDGGVSALNYYISVSGVAPAATFNAPASVQEGIEFSVSLTGPDDVSAPDAVAGYEYAFDFGSGYGNWSSSNSAAFTPTDGGDLTVKGKIRDKDNAEREYTAVVTVNNVDPSVSADTDPVTVNEGVTAANTGTYADAGGGTVTLAASIGIVVNNGNGTWSWSADTSNISEASTTVTITATDANSAEMTTTFALNVTNLAPGLTLTNQVNSLPENTDTSDSPVIVADINIVDFARGTNLLSLSGEDASFFTISNGQLALRADAVLDYESTPTLHVTVNVNDDSVGESPDASVDFTLSLTPVNEDPTAIALSANSVDENQPTPTDVGTFSTTDPDTGESFTYSLVSGTGDADNGLFSISGNVLQATSSFDAEAQGPFSIRVRSTDSGGLSTEETFVITINDLNEPPTAVVLTPASASLAEDVDTTSAITLASISATDDALGTDTLTLTGPDAALFSIVGTDLRLKAGMSLDFETKDTYSVTVNADDATLGAAGSIEASASFTLTITNVNDNAPVVSSGQSFNVLEDATPGESVGFVVASDADGSSFSTWVIVSGNDDGVFSINASTGEITVANNSNLDAEGTASYSLGVRVFDGQRFSATETVTINVTNVNDNQPVVTPGQVFSVSEDAASGTSVGFVTATDADGDSLFPWVIVSGNDDGVFSINATTGKITIANNSNLDAEGTASYSLGVRVFDGRQYAAMETVQVDVTNVNEAPEIGNVGSGFTTTERAQPRGIATEATLTDVDTSVFDGGVLTVSIISGGEATDLLAVRSIGQLQVSGSNVTFGGVLVGTLVPGNGEAAMTLTFNGNAEREMIETILHHVTFQTTSLNPSTSTRLIDMEISDGEGATSSPVSIQVHVTPINDAPVIEGFDTSLSYREGHAERVLDQNAVVTDVDSPDFDGGTLTVQLIANGEADDVLAIRNDGTAAGQVGVSGSDVTFGGLVIGSFSGGNGSPLVVTFNSNADATAVQALLRKVTFANTSRNPSPLNRTLQVVLDDGDGNSSVPVAKIIQVEPINDAPVISGLPVSVDYTENDPPVLLSPSGSIVDIDSTHFSGGQLIVSFAKKEQSRDVLSILPQGPGPGEIGLDGNNVQYDGTVIGTFTGGTFRQSLVVTFNAQASPEAAEALLRRVAFSHASENMNDNARIIEFQLTDGDGGTSLPVEVAINGIPEADPPILGDFGPDIIYREGQHPSLIDSDMTVESIDSADFDGGTLTVTLTANATSDDQFGIRESNRITLDGYEVLCDGMVIGTFTGGDGSTPMTVNLNSNATAIRVQTLLRRITFENTSENPSNLKRTVQVTLSDGDGATSNPVTKSIQVIPENDAPVIANFGPVVNYSPSVGQAILAPNVLLSDVDQSSFPGGKIVVDLLSGYQSRDNLFIINEGTGAGQIGVSGKSITYAGTVMGTFSGGFLYEPLEINLNANATTRAVQSLLRRLAFRHLSDNLRTSTRTVEVTLEDGQGGISTPVTKSIEIAE